MARNNVIELCGFKFIHNFDSGNLGHVESVPTELITPIINQKTNVNETPNYEFNLWTRPDCAGTEFENGNRTWFYFGIQSAEPGILVRLNLINLNKQGKMYNQGMAPVTRTLPGRPQWERIKDRPVHSTDDNTFSLSFKYRTSENIKATTFFAFTYPFSFAELQIALNSIDIKMLPLQPALSDDDIYYYRECLIYSLEGRRVDLLTITSHHGITREREERLKNLFPENLERPYKFQNKKIIFMSARVHPGETPSSFVFNGFLNLLLNKTDPVAIHLRKLYVFKMIPFLNPDGVARGHYRTDTRGVNLNRVYVNPSLMLHPTVYASRSLIRYYHFGYEKEEGCDDSKSFSTRSLHHINENAELDLKKKKPIREQTSLSKDKKSQKSTIKQTPSIGSKKNNTVQIGEENSLAEQVLDMKIDEIAAQSFESTPKQKGTEQSILNDNLLRNCLGSEVHLSNSDEMCLQGGNPLRPLREALKNSINLLMESNPSLNSNETSRELFSGSVKVSWCIECRKSIEQLETDMPGMTSTLPSFITDTDTEPIKLEAGDTLFCTNCFKRYMINDKLEEIKIADSIPSSEVEKSDNNILIIKEPVSEVVSCAQDVHIPIIPKEEKNKPSISKQAPIPALIKKKPTSATKGLQLKEPESNLFLYIDLHGHASKKGIFMYGNHFEDVDSSIECMLLPRIMSLNNLHFHFSSCNFTERNMYLKDRRDGMSREGSGRVAVLKATGLVRSYTLECNYNTGRLVNVLPPTVKEGPNGHSVVAPNGAPPKYTPHIYEEVGRALGASILDLTGQHPNSRIPCSEHRNVTSIREWLRTHSRSLRPSLTMSRLRPKATSPNRVPLFPRPKIKVTDERKENAYTGAKADLERKRSPPVFKQRSTQEIINMNVKLVKKNEPVKLSRTRYLTENESKPKSLTSKRRNILAIRKPNTSKTQSIVKAKISRRTAEDGDSKATMTKITKRNYSRSMRSVSKVDNRKAGPSSSDDLIGNWEDVAEGTVLGSQSGVSHDALSMTGKRRQFPAPTPAILKKIRLKTGL